jgi:ubiquinone/menaquinone biosynthesis C-methylase UbiE
MGLNPGRIIMTTDGPNEGQDGGTYGSAAAAEGWRRIAGARTQDVDRITERMLDLAGIEPGYRVLDVAAGAGEPTLLAARRVGPNGFVLATDIADRLLSYLDEAAKEAGLANVETRVMDARQLDLEPASFDAAICRMALMLIPERDLALAGIRRALRPGRKLAVVVMSTAEKHPHIAQSLAIARRHAGLPPAPFEDPGMFALGDPAVLRACFERAGFRDVTIEPVVGQQRFPSLAAAMEHRRNVLPEMRPLLASLSDAEQDAVWAEIEEVMRQFEGVDGVVVPNERLLCVGTKEQDDR